MMLLPTFSIMWTMIGSGCGDSGATVHGDCRIDRSTTAATSVIYFLGDVQQGRLEQEVRQGRDVTLTGGVDDPFQCAYDRLCEDQRDDVSEDEFRSTKGAVVSDLLTADSHAGPSVYVDRGLAQERAESETLDPELKATWVEIEATRSRDPGEPTTISEARDEEQWRVDLVREDGSWRACGFTLISR
jgi:hypothetical protein